MTQVAILGAGIAGLSSGWLLQQRGIEFILLEKQPNVGGLARSFQWHGFSCDFAAHRLFTQNEAILQQLLNLVPMGRHIRRSRIYLQGHWMRDPLDVIELGLNLSISERIKILWTYLTRTKNLPETAFRNYVVRRYGESLYKLFFKPYTEKLFGISGDEISVLWAKQKVRLANPLDNLHENTKTKFQYFYYPILGGYGSISNKLYDEIKEHVKLESTVLGFEKNNSEIISVIYEKNGTEYREPVKQVISTLPMSITARMLGHQINLKYQKVDAVYVLVNKPLISDYHWIYFIDDTISINRMVEFKNMSSVGTPEKTTVICAEVTQNHDDVESKVVQDLIKTGLINEDNVLDTKVVHEPFAYPVYNQSYDRILTEAKSFFNQYQNLYLVGRAAEFRHREADDNFEAAIETVNDIASKVPSVLRKPEERSMNKQTAIPSVYTVLLTYNHYQDTHECLKTVIASDYPEHKIVLVDNGSDDNTPQKVRTNFPQVHIIENNRNLGVPGGYNIGFKYALESNADYILMLNNDTIIPENMITELVTIAESDSATGIVMPKILYYGSNERVWSSGGRYRSFPPAILMTDSRKGIEDTKRLIEYAPSCGLLIHKRAFQLAGLFDPGYFILYDDWDFSERVRAHGLKILFTPSIHMWHKVSVTTQGPRSPFFWHNYGASIVRYWRRHGRPVWFSLPVHLGYIILREFLWKRNWNYWSDFLEGAKEGLQKPLGEVPTLAASKISEPENIN